MVGAMRKASFAPIVDARTRLLLLGSLPGDESLRRGQYYAHPQNRFWELVGSAIAVDLRALDYRDRLAALRDHRIGLWDVVADALRSGSLDAAIRDAADNDLAGLVARLPRLAAIGFNGKRAAAAGRRMLAGLDREIALVDLPSSSPAFAAMRFEEKRAAWQALAGWLGRES